jgi:hypothetical protein
MSMALDLPVADAAMLRQTGPADPAFPRRRRCPVRLLDGVAVPVVMTVTVDFDLRPR